MTVTGTQTVRDIVTDALLDLEVGAIGTSLHAGSRGAGDGSRNYVVFDDKLIEILRKYGLVPGMIGAGAYGMQPTEAQAGQ